MTYTLISLPFLIGAALVWWRLNRPARRDFAVLGIVSLVLLVLTAIFDNLMIAAGLVGYGSGQRLGLSVGLVPVEDFFYSLFVALIVTALWKKK